jgi:hypothetical protein
MTEIRVAFSVENAKKLLLILIAIETAGSIVYIASWLTDHDYMHEVFRTAREQTVFTWLSIVQLFVIGLLFFWHNHWPGVSRIVKPGFLVVVAIGFMYLSVDEASELHELVTSRLKHYDWAPRWFRGNHGIWIPFYLGIAVVLLVAGFHTAISMLKVYPRQSLYMISGFALAVFGGVVLEGLGYIYLRSLNRGIIYAFELALEEFFEMAGMSIVLYGALLCSISKSGPVNPGHSSSPIHSHSVSSYK